MIVITQDKNSITIEGHAGFAPIGQDIVCAGISALLNTLLLSLDKLVDDDIKHAVSAGYSLIEYKNLSERAQVLVDSFFIGVKAIADTYPNHVRYVSKL
jgi:uncharacterized protein YsxB (DUF464 family)